MLGGISHILSNFNRAGLIRVSHFAVVYMNKTGPQKGTLRTKS